MRHRLEKVSAVGYAGNAACQAGRARRLCTGNAACHVGTGAALIEHRFYGKVIKTKTKMVSKTRDKFIEVARQLFARKGVENTTMNDIASASDKGRRTIYTYFKNKRDIYNAVVESESDKLMMNLRLIVARPVSAEEKLKEYVAVRFETMREIVSRNGSLRAGFFRDVRKVDRARKLISKKEIAMLREILEEGVQNGEFEITDLNHTSVIVTHAIQGLDVTYIRDSLSDKGIDQEMLAEYFSRILLKGIIKR